MASTEEAAAAAAAAATAEDAVRVNYRGGMAFVPGMRPISVRRRRRATRRPTHSPHARIAFPRAQDLEAIFDASKKKKKRKPAAAAAGDDGSAAAGAGRQVAAPANQTQP
jgi:hypothetical protein